MSFKQNKETYGLFRSSYPENVREYLDMDLSNLSQEEAEWASQFLLEYYNTSFKKDPTQWLHKDRGELWNPKNSRNRDLYAISGIPRDGYERGFLVFDAYSDAEESQDRYYTQEQVSQIGYGLEDSLIATLEIEEEPMAGTQPETIQIEVKLPEQTILAKGEIFLNGSSFMARDVVITDTQGKKAFVSSDEKVIIIKKLIKERETKEDFKQIKKKAKKESNQW